MFIGAYVGARPLGRPLPPLGEVPQSAQVPLFLIYSFARDAAKDGRFEFYDPWQLETAVRQQCGNQRGMLSLAGAGFSWGSAVGLDEWVANALDSLQRMLDKYGLVGLDINYEEGLDERGGFAEAMAALIAQLKAWRASLLVTISPYCATWPHYRQLLQLAGASIDFVNWQLYAELESPDATAEEAVAVYERLAREVGGYSKLTLGVNTEPKDLRGPRLGACLAALHVLKGRGIGGAFVWALDNSCGCGFQAESALLRIAGEPTGVHAQQQQGQAAGGGAQQAATGGAAASGGGQHVASYSGSTCCCIG